MHVYRHCTTHASHLFVFVLIIKRYFPVSLSRAFIIHFNVSVRHDTFFVEKNTANVHMCRTCICCVGGGGSVSLSYVSSLSWLVVSRERCIAHTKGGRPPIPLPPQTMWRGVVGSSQSDTPSSPHHRLLFHLFCFSRTTFLS